MDITFILNLVQKKKVCRWGGSFSTYGISGMSTSTKNFNPQPEQKISIPNKKNDVLFTIISESNQKNIYEINSTNPISK